MIIKSIEDNVSNMYEARRRMLGLEKEAMPPKPIREAVNSNASNGLRGNYIYITDINVSGVLSACRSAYLMVTLPALLKLLSTHFFCSLTN